MNTSRMIVFNQSSNEMKRFVEGLADLGIVRILKHDIKDISEYVIEFEGIEAAKILSQYGFNIVEAPKWR